MSDHPTSNQGKTPWLIALGALLVALRLGLEAYLAGLPPGAMPHPLVGAVRDLLLLVSRSCGW